MVWKKPAHIADGIVWHKFTGRVKVNGKPLEYKVKDISKDLIEPCIDHMVRHFVVRETFMAHEGFAENGIALKQMKQVWRKQLLQGVGLVAIVEGEGDESKRIAGLNILQIVEKDDPKEQFEEHSMKKIMSQVSKLYEKVNIFETYGVERYLTALGLSVAANYQGDGVSHNLFKARVPMCQALGITVAFTPFSYHAGVHEIEKEGYKVINSFPTDELKVLFPRVKNPYLVLTVKVLSQPK